MMKKLITITGRGKIVLPGGSGFLGRSLAEKLLHEGYEVVILTRRPKTNGKIREIYWDGKNQGAWTEELEGAAGVVNFTGKSVNCRYNRANCQEINASRVDSVRAIDQALSKCKNPPLVLVQAASLAIYGDAGEKICDETTSPGEGLPVETCLLWEKTFTESKTPQTRRVLLRIGFALGRNGGALETLAKITNAFLGGTVGSGKQYISWIHLEDLNRMFLRALEDREIEGTYNATGLEPVTNRIFMKELRKVLRRPWSPPVPAWAVRVGCFFMRTEACLALTGRRCLPVRFEAQKFQFKYPDLHQALAEILKPAGEEITS